MSQNQSVIITGASDGIGKALAHAFARRGYRIGIIARREAQLEKVKSECLALGAPLVEFSVTDVTDVVLQRTALKNLDARLGGIGVFIANAGGATKAEAFKDCGEQVRQTIAVNVTAAFDGLEWMKARMLEQGHGTIVGVASVAATRGLPNSGAYSACKAAMINYLETLRCDLRGRNVRVLTIAPGFIRTPGTSVMDDPMPFLMDAEKAGEIFARQIIAGKKFIVAPWQYRPLYHFARLLPGWFYEWLIALILKQ